MFAYIFGWCIIVIATMMNSLSFGSETVHIILGMAGAAHIIADSIDGLRGKT